MLVFSAGCQNRCSDHSKSWLWLPHQQNGKWTAYYIVRTNSLDPTNLINVQVKGWVNRSGDILLPEGSSTLEAVAAASGFARGANYNHIVLMRENLDYDLVLRQQGWLRNHSHAWYEQGLETNGDGHRKRSQHGHDFFAPQWG